ncbi:hypothetical protein HKX48_003355 [Thoreauomyces humboldtii]|nr:hypothetical protein HKX48_003355 [Thoreauomyces humboldtii]
MPSGSSVITSCLAMAAFVASSARASAVSLPATVWGAKLVVPDLGKNGSLFTGTEAELITRNHTLWYAFAAVLGSVLLILACLCMSRCSCRRSGANAGYTPSLNAVSMGRPQLDRHVSLPRALGKPRSRKESLPENRKSFETGAASAADMFVAANGNRREFPVVRVHVKKSPDEFNLTVGDQVVLNHVFPDGWAAGVSKRAGGPFLFPVICLGGSVPRVLVQREAAQRSAGGPPPNGGMRMGPARYSGMAHPPPVRPQQPLPSPRSYAEAQRGHFVGGGPQAMRSVPNSYFPRAYSPRPEGSGSSSPYPPGPASNPPSSPLPQPPSPSSPSYPNQNNARPAQPGPLRSPVYLEDSASGSGSNVDSSDIPSPPASEPAVPPPAAQPENTGGRVPTRSVYSVVN